MAQTYDEWMKEVDAVVTGAVGCSVHDLADQPFDDWHRDGVSAREAAQKALESEGYEL